MVHACDFVWKIENFTVATKQNRDFIVSPIFTSKVLDETGWRVVLTLDGEFMNVCVRRILLDKGPLCIDGGFQICAMDVDGRQCRNKRVQGVFLKGRMLTCNTFVLKHDVCVDNSPLLVSDTLTLKGQVYRHSTMECPVEKIMIRSRLGMEEEYFKMTVNPHDYCFKREIPTDGVRPGFTLTCKWYRLEREPPFNVILPSLTITPQSETTSSIFVWAKITLRQCSVAYFETEDVHRFEAGSTGAWTLADWQSIQYELEGFDDCYYMDLLCRISISDGEKEDVYDQKHAELFENYRKALALQPKNDFLSDVKSVALSKLFPDMLIKGDDYTYSVHRCILSARSNLLRNLLLEADAKWKTSKAKNPFCVICRVGSCASKVKPGEGSSNAANQAMHRVTVTKTKEGVVAVFTGVCKRIMQAMLAFMYSDSLYPFDYQTTLQLLQASDLYQINGLKRWCENSLENRITSVSRAWEVLLVANSLHSNVLRRAARLYMYENKGCFMRYIAWRVFEDEEDKDFLRFYSTICDLSR